MVGQRRVHILNQVVPGMPLPHHFAARRQGGGNFSDGLGPHQLGVHPSSFRGFLLRLQLPGQDEHVAVGHPCKVVVMVLGVVCPIQPPFQLAVPRHALQPPPNTAAGKGTHHPAAACQTAILQEVARAARVVVAGPGLDDLATVVDEVGVGAAHGVEQRVAIEGLRGIEEGSYGLGLSPCGEHDPTQASQRDPTEEKGNHESVVGHTVSMRSLRYERRFSRP